MVFEMFLKGEAAAVAVAAGAMYTRAQLNPLLRTPPSHAPAGIAAAVADIDDMDDNNVLTVVAGL